MDTVERLDTEGMAGVKAFALDRLPEDLTRLADGHPVWGVDVPGTKGAKMTVMELDRGFRLLTCMGGSTGA